jgi:hypothetical protein
MKYKINVKVKKRFDANADQTDNAGNPLAPLIQTVFAFGTSITLDFTQAVTAEELKSVTLEKLNDPSLAEVRLLAKSVELVDTDPVTANDVMLEAMIGLSAEHEVPNPTPTSDTGSARSRSINRSATDSLKPAYDKSTRLAALTKFKEMILGSSSNKITKG